MQNMNMIQFKQINHTGNIFVNKNCNNISHNPSHNLYINRRTLGKLLKIKNKYSSNIRWKNNTLVLWKTIDSAHLQSCSIYIYLDILCLLFIQMIFCTISEAHCKTKNKFSTILACFSTIRISQQTQNLQKPHFTEQQHCLLQSKFFTLKLKLFIYTCTCQTFSEDCI